eukprot:8296111-Pyramimonas_sp.AAC.1
MALGQLLLELFDIALVFTLEAQLPNPVTIAAPLACPAQDADLLHGLPAHKFPCRRFAPDDPLVLNLLYRGNGALTFGSDLTRHAREL